jgi:hypothetical protein
MIPIELAGEEISYYLSLASLTYPTFCKVFSRASAALE